MIKLAALASRTVYHKLVLPEIGEESVETNVFSSTKYFSASSDGNIKAASLSHLMTDDCSTLFIAIRGSASLMDWLVNADGDPVEVGENFLASVLFLFSLLKEWSHLSVYFVVLASSNQWN